jgi:hypothetical protein
MLFGNDVLDLESKATGIVFVKAAVLATTSCALSHQGAERSFHHSPAEFARSWRAFDFRIARNVSK